MASLTDISPAAILAGAECYDCALTPSQLKAAQTYLLCNINKAAVPPCVTPTAPTSAGAKTVGNTSILIGWSQPANTGSLITGYIVSWGTTSGVYTNTSAVLPRLPRLFTITGLSTGTQYFWVVKAVAFTGCTSAASSESNATTTGAPPTPFAVSDWVARVQANGDPSPSAAVITAVTTWYNALVAASIDSLIVSCGFMNLGRAITCKTPFFKVAGSDPWVETAGITYGANGITSDQLAGHHINTGVNPFTAFASGQDCGLSIYVYQSANSMNEYTCGAYDGTHALWIQDANNTLINAGQVTVASTGFNGWISINRNTINSILYSANSVTPHSAIGTSGGASSTVLPNFPIWLMDLDSSGAGTEFSADTVSFFAIHKNMTQVQNQAFYNATQALLVATGGGSR